MQGDALDMFRAMRPEAPSAVEGLRSAGSLPNGQRDLHSLAMVPGTPGYNSRIPLPPCAACGEDHVPNHEYGHPWMAQQFHDEPVSAGPVSRRPQIVERAAQEAPAQLRVAIYIGRGDTYVASVEEAPDWDSVDTYRVSGPELLLLVRMVRSLGVKVADKTGGDLVMLEEESDQPQKTHAGGAASAGDRGARRQRQLADRPQVNQPGEGDDQARQLPEPASAGEGAA